MHTPGHSPGHMCFWEKEKGYLYTGDLVYQDMLTAWFPSTDPYAYLQSLEKIAGLPAKRVFPAHHSQMAGFAMAAESFGMAIGRCGCEEGNTYMTM